MTTQIIKLNSKQWKWIEPSFCPICGGLNMVCNNLLHVISEADEAKVNTVGTTRDPIAMVEYRGKQHEVYHGSGCWNSMFGDRCGKCNNVVTHIDSPVLAEVYTHVDPKEYRRQRRQQ